MNVEDDIVKDVKFEGEGCSISMASASMMTQDVKGETIEAALQLAHTFSDMMLGKDIDESIDLEDIEALSGCRAIPCTYQMCNISWKAMEKGVSGASQAVDHMAIVRAIMERRNSDGKKDAGNW